MAEVATLHRLEYLQERLLAGDECRYDSRSPNTVNSVMGAVMAFVRFCKGRGWVAELPLVQKLEAEEVMKGRPITEVEFQRMRDAVSTVVGTDSANSWLFALDVLWESGFRVGDLMNFSWDNPGTFIRCGQRRRTDCQRLPFLPRRRMDACKRFQCCPVWKSC